MNTACHIKEALHPLAYAAALVGLDVPARFQAARQRHAVARSLTSHDAWQVGQIGFR